MSDPSVVATVLCESDHEWDDDDVVFLDSSAVRVARDLENEQLLREQALRDAEAEGLTLKKSASNPTGFVCVKEWPETHQRRREMARGAGHRFFAYRRAYGPSEFREYLGSYVTAEEAALANAKPPRNPFKPGPVPPPTEADVVRLSVRASARTIWLRTRSLSLARICQSLAMRWLSRPRASLRDWEGRRGRQTRPARRWPAARSAPRARRPAARRG